MRRAVWLLCLFHFVNPPMAMNEETIQRFSKAFDAANATPLIHAHAHNDYTHEVPLQDALRRGFCSVEADIFLVNGRLLVGHSRSDLEAERTLEALYLDPLLARVRNKGGRVFAGGPVFTLLIDIKSNGEETYRALDSVLGNYDEMLTTVNDAVVETRAVTAIISGDRAWESIVSDPTRYAGVDGRLADLSSNRPSHLMPLISDRWSRVFNWNGQGPMPAAERTELLRIVQDAHSGGRRVRFWGTPDRPSPARTAVWTELLEAGVDLIGTDDLAGLQVFLLSHPRNIPAEVLKSPDITNGRQLSK